MPTRTSLALALVLCATACSDDTGDDASDATVDGSTNDGAAVDATADAAPPFGFDAETDDGGDVGGDTGPASPDGSPNPGDAATPALDADVDADRDASTSNGPDAQVAPPHAGFQLSTSSGRAPLAVQATSGASMGSAPLSETLYDWGDGAGYVASAAHGYLQPGTFTVTQRVRDANGLTASASATIVVSPDDFAPVRFNRADASPAVGIAANGYDVDYVDRGPGGVRSDAAVAPGSGVFYFEGHRFTSQWHGGGFGVATASATLGESIGTSGQSMGAVGWGPIQNAGGTCSGLEADSALPDLGFVVDYRAANPIIHVLQEGGTPGTATVRATCVMGVSAPLHVFYSGERSLVGVELRINTGADTTNFPFRFGAAEVRAALTASNNASTADALVMGFGKTRALPPDSAPVLTVSGTKTVALGQQVILNAQADDAEEGAISARITWVDLASQHHARVQGSGPSFTFTPNSIGLHPVEVSVADALGRTTTQLVKVRVTGTLPQFSPVALASDPLTGVGITISPDGLSATFNGTGKDGIRANQGIYGRFWYFEVHRDSPIRNMGMGLVIGDGVLNPYDPINVPWSCSLNTLGGFWVNLVGAGGWPQNTVDADYGFAVDYRGENPRVHIIIGGVLQGTLLLDQVWVPLYPMLYGNPPEAPLSGTDMTLNFGTKPFVFDVRTILGAAGVDTSALELGWGLTPATSS